MPTLVKTTVPSCPTFLLQASRDSAVKQLEAHLEEANAAAAAKAKEAAAQAKEAAKKLQAERDQGKARSEQLEREVDRA